MGFVLNFIGFLLLIVGLLCVIVTGDKNKNNLFERTFGDNTPTKEQLIYYNKFITKVKNTSFICTIIGFCILLARLFS